MLLFVSTIKLVAEIALLCLLGQGALALLAGQRRDDNPFYRVLAVATGPFVRAARWVTPRVVLDRHVPLVAFLLLAMAWLAATVARIGLCVDIGVERCL